MTLFRDRALLELSDPVALGAQLLPAGDTTGARVRTMLAATYDLTSVRVDQIGGAPVGSVAVQRPLFPVGRQDGAWSQTQPSFTRTELTLNVPAAADPIWIDLLATVDVTVVTEVDPSGVESAVVKALDDFTTLAEFRARFAFFDLDAFLAEHHISTVDELRDAFDYLVADVQFRTPGTFDPNDPANTHVLPVTLAVVVADPFDAAEGLRATRLVREAARTVLGPTPASVPAEAVEAYATAVVFADPGQGNGLTAADVEQLYAREGVVSLALPAN